jgi:hypothetical protein
VKEGYRRETTQPTNFRRCIASGAYNHHAGQLSRPPENRILRGQIKGRLLLSEGEKATLAEIAHRLGRMVLEEVAATAKPDTILGWYRKLIAKKFDGSKFRRRVGRLKVDQETERLVVRMARSTRCFAALCRPMKTTGLVD